jgi:pilus assembly protein CpaF
VDYLEFTAIKPIRHLLVDPEISEIMINGCKKLFVEKGGKILALKPIFQSQTALDSCVESLMGLTGRAVNARSPFVDFRLPDGSRINVVVPPIALDGPYVTIRRVTKSLKTLDDIVAKDTLTARMADFLCACVDARMNMIFTGGTGSGKTTLLGMLSASIAEDERIVVIEDTAELELAQPHVVRMECRPPNIEGSGAIVLADLLKNSMRMRPTRIIVGEVRGEEAFDLLGAMSSGHEGGFAVLHASSPAQALQRLATMVLSKGLPFPLWAIQNQIASAIHIIVQHAFQPDGSRRVTHITSVEGVKDDVVHIEDLFVYDHDGVDKQGKSGGRFVCTGFKPRSLPRIRRACGVGVDQLLLKGVC